ncbi:MAG: hypothetical protein AABW99_01645 [archaeon]
MIERPRTPGNTRTTLLKLVLKHQDISATHRGERLYGHVPASKFPVFMRELADVLFHDERLAKIMVGTRGAPERIHGIMAYALERARNDPEKARAFLDAKIRFVTGLKAGRSIFFSSKQIRRYSKKLGIPGENVWRTSSDFAHMLGFLTENFVAELQSAWIKIK